MLLRKVNAIIKSEDSMLQSSKRYYKEQIWKFNVKNKCYLRF